MIWRSQVGKGGKQEAARYSFKWSRQVLQISKGTEGASMQECRRRTFQAVGTASAKILGVEACLARRPVWVEHCELGAGVV